MKETLFLGVATVLDAIGAFLASINHRYTAYGCFASAIIMVGAAILTTFRGEYRLRRGKTELGRVLVQLSQCELEAYDGNNDAEYDSLEQRITEIKSTVGTIARKYLDPSVESRFLAVNVLDVHLDEATRMHFISRAQGSFWTMYQQLHGWRECLVDILRER